MKKSTETLKIRAKEEILSDIEQCRSTVPALIENILAFNTEYPEERLEFDSLGKNHDFLVRCAYGLNDLYEIKQEEAKKLTTWFRSTLSNDGKIIFDVWCRVNHIIEG